MTETVNQNNGLSDKMLKAQERFDALCAAYYDEQEINQDRDCSVDSKEHLLANDNENEGELELDHDDAERPDYKLTTPTSGWYHGQEQFDSDNHHDEPDEEPAPEPEYDPDYEADDEDVYDNEDDDDAYVEDSDFDLDDDNIDLNSLDDDEDESYDDERDDFGSY